MFEGGSIWRPPSKNFFTAGMPDELIEGSERCLFEFLMVKKYILELCFPVLKNLKKIESRVKSEVKKNLKLQ